ncbi:hypothetical protein [Oscillatoria salina]|uniref:hypothetical protein n=1 Tax=Oscillatoria salina TaxID=331517 RepID=UPI0013BDDECB|nr:hypothetical protein [Oscillatoria salina]MBZ8179802.1 hypothetical protein [Oscillatoria salina IIICB1]NET87687.1 hypothetical protein [Kamptonema sp. SIO1D9]
MFGFIKNIFSGIINFITGIFGGKKEGFFLELDESQNGQSTNPKKAEKPKSQPAKTEAAQSEKKSEPAKQEQKKPEPVKAQTAKPEPKKPQPAAAKANKNGKVESPEETTFAPQYLAPTPSRSRRRPGPSLNMFKDMARQVNNQ